MARKRVIYQSEALFISPDTTGHHVFYKPKYEDDNLGNCIITGKDIDNNDTARMSKLGYDLVDCHSGRVRSRTIEEGYFKNIYIKSNKSYYNINIYIV